MDCSRCSPGPYDVLDEAVLVRVRVDGEAAGHLLSGNGSVGRVGWERFGENGLVGTVRWERFGGNGSGPYDVLDEAVLVRVRVDGEAAGHVLGLDLLVVPHGREVRLERKRALLLVAAQVEF